MNTRYRNTLAALAATFTLAACGASGQGKAETPAGGTDVLTAPEDALLDGSALERMELDYAERVPLPPDADFATWRAEVHSQPQNDRLSRAVVEQSMQFWAGCQWVQFWLTGRQSADRGAVAVALATMRTMPTWETYTSTENMVPVVQQIADAAQAGDPAPATRFVELNC